MKFFYGLPDVCVGWPARSNLHRLCADTGCNLEDLCGAMGDRGGLKIYIYSQENSHCQRDLMMMMMMMMMYKHESKSSLTQCRHRFFWQCCRSLTRRYSYTISIQSLSWWRAMNIIRCYERKLCRTEKEHEADDIPRKQLPAWYKR